MGARRRKKKRDSATNKRKGDGSGKHKTLDGADKANKKEELSSKMRKMDSKKSGEQVDTQNLAENKVTANISFLDAVQNKWGRFMGYIKNQTNSILKRMNVRKRQRDNVNQSGINKVKGSAEVGKEEETGKKRKQQEDLAPSKYDISDECSGPSRKQRRNTVPLTLDKFIFHSVLGKGSFGKVILATDSISNESVAIKILKKRSLIVSNRFLVENHVLRLAHRSSFLIHGYAAFHTQNYAYYVTELACGGNLLQYLHVNQPDMDEIRFITAEIICGLRFMHSNGIIHRDLKLNNILLTGDGHIKIADFGLSLYKVYGRVKATGCPGTPGYVAPEIIMRQLYDAGVDYFALGVILYRMIFHCRPFPGVTIAEILKKVIDHEPSYEKVTDNTAVDITSRLLSKDQSVRLGVNGNLKNHPFFSNLNWTEIETGKAPSPVVVRKNMDVCMSRWVPAPNSEDLKEPIPAERQEIFNDFAFVCPAWRESYHNAHGLQRASHHN
ncbi:protein kinase C delta type-like [Rhinoderma darwinii]|uniref:protein kinase C delta type-like n=1 Tax=Rhinoderma darwinii TaxID=43563 RepID=UPI003F67E840